MMINTLGMRSTPLRKIQNDLTWYLQNMSKVDELMVSSHAIWIWFFVYVSIFSFKPPSNQSVICVSGGLTWFYGAHFVISVFVTGSSRLSQSSVFCLVIISKSSSFHFFFCMFPKCAKRQPYLCGQGPINGHTGLLKPLTSEYLMKDWWHWQNGG